MDKKIKSISKYSDEKLQEYFNTETLKILHEMKLYADHNYYNEGKETGFDDYQYDMLKETLQHRDPNYKVPIGAKIREGENRVKLPFWLGSMDKFKPEDDSEIKRWLDKNRANDYIIEDKLDGVSCLVVVKKGRIKLYTRGDGIIGADISYLAPYFDTIPEKIDVDISIRGELIMPVDVFNKKYSKEYANPRNMVAGRIGAKKIREGISDIKFIAYEIVGEGIMDKPSVQLNYLQQLGFSTVKNEIVHTITTETLIETFLRFKNDNIFEIDGIIIQPDKKYERNTDGNPDYAFAFKMRLKDNIVEAEVVDVTWNVSKWGQLKPRIKIKPVKLGGVTITYTTGFNAKYIYDNKIGEGAKIKITRSGDVIPYIVEVVKKAKEPDMPVVTWKWNKSGVDIITDELDAIMCIKLLHSFFDKLNVKQLGEQRIGKLYVSGLDTLLKIIAASKKRISESEGIGDKIGQTIHTNIKKSLQNVYVADILGASGIFGFGIGRVRVNNLFDEIPNILEYNKTMTKKELYTKIMQIEGFSDITTKNIIDNIDWAIKFITALDNFAVFKKRIIVGNNMDGLKVVFTGFRDVDLQEKIVARGGKVSNSVSKNTNILVVANKNAKLSGKATAAKKLGIEILEKDEFINKYIDNN
jgi:NAD-dependent DNA ligase